MSDIKPILAKVADGQTLSTDEAEHAFEALMSGKATPGQIGGFLMGLRVRGETVDEIIGGVKVMRSKALPVSAPDNAIDTCGTGGDGAHTLNISTAVTFVVAGCGVPIAKHGNKALSSKSGSADVLERLGVKLDVPPEKITACIRDAGVGFMMAPFHHSAMKHVGPVRAEMGVRTIFNLMGPLSNPAGAKRQLIGVYAKEWLVPMAEVLKNLGSDKVWLVHGSDGLDEITITGSTYAVELNDGNFREFEITPEEVGLTRATLNDIRGGDSSYNADRLRALLNGEQNAYRDIVVLNSAAALVVAGKAADLTEGAALANSSINMGDALEALNKLVEVSNAP